MHREVVVSPRRAALPLDRSADLLAVKGAELRGRAASLSHTVHFAPASHLLSINDPIRGSHIAGGVALTADRLNIVRHPTGRPAASLSVL